MGRNHLTRYWQRDKHGWRVPRKGTISRKVYDLVLAEHQPYDIAVKLGMDSNTVRVLIHRFKHPTSQPPETKKDV